MNKTTRHIRQQDNIIGCKEAIHSILREIEGSPIGECMFSHWEDNIAIYEQAWEYKYDN